MRKSQEKIMKIKKKEKISFTLDCEVVKRLYELRSRDCLNMSAFVNSCLLQALGGKEDEER